MSNFQFSQKHISKQRGFTLIELMLVLAVVIAMSIIGLAAYQQQILNRRVEKTSLQMQIILQAGLDYYANTGNWPTASSPGSSIITTLQNGGYITSSLTDNPWGEPYTAAVITNPTSNVTLFQVSSTVPVTMEPGSSLATNIARMIAGHLPMASSTTDSNNDGIVNAQVNSPGGGVGPNAPKTIIQDVETISMADVPGTQVQIPQNCPAGYTPAIDVALSSFSSYMPANKQTSAYIVSSVNPSCAVDTANPNMWDLSAVVQTVGINDNGSGNVTYITTCKLSTDQTRSTLCNPTNSAQSSLPASHFVF